MAATTEQKRDVLSIVATVGARLPELVIKNGQMIFVQDKHKIALDFGGKRTFYNQIEEVETEEARKAMNPENGVFYFVIDTAVLWTYRDKWIPLTTPPSDVIFIGTKLPTLGSNNTLYVNRTGGISIWDENKMEYIRVADKNDYTTESDIDSLFN